jgi:hypothetical protein
MYRLWRSIFVTLRWVCFIDDDSTFGFIVNPPRPSSVVPLFPGIARFSQERDVDYDIFNESRQGPHTKNGDEFSRSFLISDAEDHSRRLHPSSCQVSHQVQRVVYGTVETCFI